MPQPLERPWRRGFGWRTLLGCVVVVLASAGAAAAVVLQQVHTVVADLSINKPLQVDSRALARSSFGQPETFLLVGNDTRSVFKYYKGYVPNLANEMLLVRIDPSHPWISMMSLPRELWVPITEPNGQIFTNRLNSAYTFGTTTLVKTIKQITGLSVNHVVATTFTQFERAINKLGCVYDTVDERYYHNNADGGAQYQNINLEPGYQCLHGGQAEQFVSYRHTDTSQVRDARDQSFLLAVKAQYGPQLIGNIGKFERVFGESVQTDRGLRTQTEILHLANLLINAVGLHVRQVPFQTTPCASTCPPGDLTASPQQIQASVNDFLHGPPAPAHHVVPSTPKHHHATRTHHRHSHVQLPVTATLAANVLAEQAAAKQIRFTAEFPKIQDMAGSALPVAAQCTQAMQPCIRSYHIRAPDRHRYPIYVEVFSNGDLGQYYDVQGTTWTSVPLLSHPTQTATIHGRHYNLYYDGSHLQTVAWHQYGAVYWVHNTLTDAVSNAELLAIAEQTAPIMPVHHTAAAHHHAAAAPSGPRHRSGPRLAAPTAPQTRSTQQFGRIAGLATLALLPLGLLAAFLRRRTLRQLRREAQAVAAQAALLEQRLATLTNGHAQLSSHPSALHPQVTRVRPAGSATATMYPAVPVKGSALRRVVPAALTLAVLAVGVATYLAVAGGSPARSATGRPHREPAPTVPVAVLNAGPIHDAAHRLAAKLTRDHVHIAAVGDLTASAPRHYEILYRSGDARQAKRLAALLRSDRPTVARTDRAAVRGTGLKARLVVVIP